MHRHFVLASNTASALLLAFLLSSCGGGGAGMLDLTSSSGNPGGGSFQDPNPPEADAELMAELTAMLEAELASLGKDISSTEILAPGNGNEVTDLQAVLLDPDGNGKQPPFGASVRWTERLLGDYDQNGLVNLADLSMLGKYFGYKVAYDDPALHFGNEFVPYGDPEDFGEVDPGSPPAAGSGAFNWRLARIDGDGNGEIGLPDVTVIAQHWQEGISGYIVMRQGPEDADFSPMPDPDRPQSPMTINRLERIASMGESLKLVAPIQYSVPDFYLLETAEQDKSFVYKVQPYCIEAAATGPESISIGVLPFADGQLNGGLLPKLSATVASSGDGNPTANDADTVIGIAPLTVDFDASASYIPQGFTAVFLWDFDGDGIYEYSSGDDPTVEHTYTDNARYDATVRIVKTNQNKSSASALVRTASEISIGQTSTIEVQVNSAEGNIPPLAGVKATNNLGQAALTVSFSAATSTDEDGTIQFYEWDFDDDGNADFSSDVPEANYTYSSAKITRTRLRVIDDKGGYDTVFVPVVISDPNGNWPPSASIVINPAFGSVPLTTTLIGDDSIDPDGSIVSYEWDIDGDFNFDINSGSQSRLTYTFGESGIYNVWLRVTDQQGQFDLERALVSVNTPPFGGIEASPSSGPGPLAVNFDASSSQDIDGTIVKYEWDFNNDGVFDLDTGILPRASKTLYSVGENTIVVRVTDNLGFSSTQSVVVTVLEPQSNLTPAATLVADVYSGSPPLEVKFTASGSDPDEDGGIDHFNWDFEGDGIIDAQTNLLGTEKLFTYAAAGRYSPSVEVVDVLGGTASASVEIVVSNGLSDPPTAHFTVNPVGSPPGAPVTFDASSSTDDNNDITKYEWDFQGDGTWDASGDASTHRNVSFTYNVLGIYNCVLRVTDGDGAVAYYHDNVIVGNAPELVVVSDRAYAEVPGAEFHLDASRSKGVEGSIAKFEWDLDGDGNFELNTGVSPFATASFDIDDLANYPGGKVAPRLKATNEIGATAITNVVQIQKLDANGQPLRDIDGNLILDENGLVPVEPVDLEIRDHYSEVEDNDAYGEANLLVGPGTDGAFDPNPAGDTLQALSASPYLRRDIPLVDSDPLLGLYVKGSLGELNLGEIYDGDDDDWYMFKLSDGAHVRVDLQFNDKSRTDLNLRLYDTNGKTILAQSLSNDQDELIDYDFRDPGFYFIRVNRFVGEGQDYRLFLKTTPIAYYPETVVDNNNDDYPNADDLQTTVIDQLLPFAWGSVDKATDPEDWYSYQYSSVITTRVRANFTHQIGDIDLFLYDQNLSLLGYSSSADDNEEIWRTLPDPGGVKTVFVKVVAHGGKKVNYTLAVGYPPGVPVGLTAQDGSNDGQIEVSWSPPPPGGNTPNGYDLYISSQKNGIYSLLAENLVSTAYVHDLTAEENWPLHLNKYWYKVKATITGQQDSEFSEADSGYVSGTKPPTLPSATTDEYLDKIDIHFYDSPTDPTFGIDKFGVDPIYYEVWADPAGGLPDTQIATFYPNNGTEVLVPADGGVAARQGLRFDYSWSGSPNWTPAQLQGVTVTFRFVAVHADRPSSSSTTTGRITGINAPTNMQATQNVFPDKIRLRWNSPSGIQPTKYFVYFRGEFDAAWTNLTPQGIPHEDAGVYEYYHQDSGQAPAAGRFKVRAYVDGYGYSPYTPEKFGFCSDLGFLSLDYSGGYIGAKYYDLGAGAWRRNVYMTFDRPDLSSVMPLYFRAKFWRGADYGWGGYHYFNREATTRTEYWGYIEYKIDSNGEGRQLQTEVWWRDPVQYSGYPNGDYTNSNWLVQSQGPFNIYWF